jgi:hypothetical protein
MSPPARGCAREVPVVVVVVMGPCCEGGEGGGVMVPVVVLVVVGLRCEGGGGGAGMVPVVVVWCQ